MKIRIISIAWMVVAALVCSSCAEDELKNESIFKEDLEKSAQLSEFDTWLNTYYRQAYNIDFKYRYSDNESDRGYNVIPADYEKSKGIAILVKHMWLDAYGELMGADFLKTYAPRIIQLTGSYKYQQNDSGESGGIVMGTAEGGIKVMLYGINSLDLDNVFVESDDPYSASKWSTTKFDLNHWFFHTMHHEFCHILTQKKEYTTEYRAISSATYHATDWVNMKDKEVAKEGFVSAYASSEYGEDFVEMYATYVTMKPSAWELILKQAGDEGKPILEQKIKIIRDYMLNSWNLDIDKLRDIVVRRSAEVTSLDLRTLPQD